MTTQSLTQSSIRYSALHCITNFSFLQGASHPQELISTAASLGYSAIAITDECSLSGIVKAYNQAKLSNIKLIVGSFFNVNHQCKLIILAPNKRSYHELSGFITLARRRSKKGEYQAHLDDLLFRLQHCLAIWQGNFYSHDEAENNDDINTLAITLKRAFKNRLWIGISHTLEGNEQIQSHFYQTFSETHQIPIVASQKIVMHNEKRKPLQDCLTAIKNNTSVQALGRTLLSNAQACLKPLHEIEKLYSKTIINETEKINRLCQFTLNEIRYQYPQELVPQQHTPISYLKKLVTEGETQRWPKGTPEFAKKIINKELSLIEALNYEFYFLTVYDIVKFARSKNILCQGRGSAANSVICYCLHITEISPSQINVLFERFISKERDEPPDIDVDFEHQRREEVIQYIYQKYSRERAAIAATIITYRPKSAIRDIGKALGFEQGLIDHFSKSLAWWDRKSELKNRAINAGYQTDQKLLSAFFSLVNKIQHFPRHLSQHVGGFIITQDKVSDLVPQENASMPDRTVIQWDKEDLESMGLLKIDVLALGMLTAMRKSLGYIQQYAPHITSLADIPREDAQNL